MKEQIRENDTGAIFGRNPVLELLSSDRDIEKIYIKRGEREGSLSKIYAMAREKKIPISEVDKSRLDEMTHGGVHQGVAAIAAMKEFVSVADIVNIARDKGEKPLIVVLDGVEDPHNVGAVIRCVDGAGAHGIIVGKRHGAPMGQTVFKASAGAAEHVPVAKVTNIAAAIDELKELGVWTFAADMDGDSVFDTDFDCPAAIVLGNEGSGISRLVREKCDFTVSIPMMGKVNSLNVSTAGAVMLFEALRSRKKQRK